MLERSPLVHLSSDVLNGHLMDCIVPIKKLASRIYELGFRIRHGVAVSNRKYETMVEQITAMGENFAAMPDDELREAAQAPRSRYTDRPPHKDSMLNALAIAREAAFRTTGLRSYDVQL